MVEAKNKDINYNELPVKNEEKVLICRFKPDTTLTEVNNNYLKTFSCSRDEVIGKKFLNLIPENARSKAKDKVNKAIEEKMPQIYEHTCIDKNGNKFYIKWIDVPVLDEHNNVEELIAAGINITSLKKIQDFCRCEKSRDLNLHEYNVDKCALYKNIINNTHRLFPVKRTEEAKDMIEEFKDSAYKIECKQNYIFLETGKVNSVIYKFFDCGFFNKINYFIKGGIRKSEEKVFKEIDKDIYRLILQKLKKSGITTVSKNIYINFGSGKKDKMLLFDYSFDNMCSNDLNGIYLAQKNDFCNPETKIPTWIKSTPDFHSEKELINNNFF